MVKFMDKPITLKYEELKQSLANLINNSGLPAFMIESILQSYLYETKMTVQRQYQLDKDRYTKSLLDSNKENE